MFVAFFVLEFGVLWWFVVCCFDLGLGFFDDIVFYSTWDVFILKYIVALQEGEGRKEGGMENKHVFTRRMTKKTSKVWEFKLMSHMGGFSHVKN